MACRQAQGEAAIRASGIGFTVVRPSRFMDNALAWAPTIKSTGVARSYRRGQDRLHPLRRHCRRRRHRTHLEPLTARRCRSAAPRPRATGTRYPRSAPPSGNPLFSSRSRTTPSGIMGPPRRILPVDRLPPIHLPGHPRRKACNRHRHGPARTRTPSYRLSTVGRPERVGVRRGTLRSYLQQFLAATTAAHGTLAIPPTRRSGGWRRHERDVFTLAIAADAP